MKNKIIGVAAISTVMAFCSCTTSLTGAHSQNGYQVPWTGSTSINEYDLEISQESITHTIDISTPEGRIKLKGLSLKEAEKLALTEAVMKHGCALLFNPQYTNLKKGDRILRITVYGFPANYKNSTKQPVLLNGSTDNSINITIDR